MNKIQLIGNLTSDPSMTTSGEKSRASFSIAVKRWKEKTDFITCVAWGQIADNIGKYVSRGDKIAVTGSLQTRTYDKDGEKRTIYEVVVEEVDFLYTTKKDLEKKSEELREGLKTARDEDLPF